MGLASFNNSRRKKEEAKAPPVEPKAPIKKDTKK